MSKKTGTFKEYLQNFLLDEQKLRKIVDVIRTNSDKLPYKTHINFYIEQEPQIFYNTSEIDDILLYDNTPDRPINTISIELYESNPNPQESNIKDPPPILLVGFTKNKETKIRYTIKCDDRDWMFLISDELDTQIKRTLVTKHSKFPFWSFDLILSLILISLGIFFSNFIINNSLHFDISSSDITFMTMEEQISKLLELSINKNTDNIYAIIYILVFTWIFAGIVFFNRPISKLIQKFNKSVFYWGDMIHIYDKNKSLYSKIIWVILFGFIVTIIGGIVVNIFF
jgi:hypothetical protein